MQRETLESWAFEFPTAPQTSVSQLSWNSCFVWGILAPPLPSLSPLLMLAQGDFLHMPLRTHTNEYLNF